jgi:hypothetical protein
MIYLVVTREGETVEIGSLCWTTPMEKVVVPPRNPDRSSPGIYGWMIAFDKRRDMGRIVMGNIESANKSSNFGHNAEENHCFYDLIRIGRRWADERDVQWWMVKTVKSEEEVRRWFRR